MNNPEKEFKVNNFITLKLEEGKTNIYVNGILFRHCTYLLINIPIEDITSFDDIESIDEASERLDPILEQPQYKIGLPPETEFWGHCSNLQAWAENNYNTKLLHRNLAFPLLKRLTYYKDPKANEVFSEEILRRYNSGYETVILYLIENQYLFYLPEREREEILLRDREKLLELLKRHLGSKEKTAVNKYCFLVILAQLGDSNAKESLNRLIINAFNTGGIETLNFINKYYTFSNLSEKEKRSLYYDNNPNVKSLIDEALKKEYAKTRFAIPALKYLIRLEDPHASNILSEIC